VRSSPIIRSIGEDYHCLSLSMSIRSRAPLGDSHGTRCQNFLRVGLSVMVNTCSSWRCAMSKTHDSLSSAGEIGEVAAVGIVR
jgi:hypothetical protein